MAGTRRISQVHHIVQSFSVDNLVSSLKEVQIQYRLGVSLGSFIMRAITVRKSWMGDVCARGRPCSPPDHWSRNLFVHPPSDAEFPAEVAAKFDEGHPWFDVMGDIMFN